MTPPGESAASYPPSPVEPPDRPHYWAHHTEALRHRLAGAIPREELKRFHQKKPALHFAIALRQLVFLAAAGYLALRFRQPWIWIPAALLEGLTIFNFTILLHDVVHNAVWTGRHDRSMRWLAGAYAFPSGISATQFTRWHLTHHAELGSTVSDPKRHYLSPKINARWLKLLYFTPALFFIYFRAARQETITYPEEIRRRISWERNLTILGHLAVAAALVLVAGWAAMARAYVVPYFVVFPIAFALNRLGQHYDIEPADPAKWGTRVKGSPFWDFVYLNSNYHLEHHYFPAVPMYYLPQLSRRLEGFFQEIDWKARSYGELFRHYIFDNKPPHTLWEP
jgi:fatty acid desaturase